MLSIYPDTYEGCLQFTLIALLYYTGIRRQELIHLTQMGSSLYHGKLKILETNKERIIPIASELKAYMKGNEVPQKHEGLKKQQPI